LVVIIVTPELLQLCESKHQIPVAPRELILHSHRYGPGYSRLLSATKDEPDIEKAFKFHGRTPVIKKRTTRQSIPKDSEKKSFKAMNTPGKA